MQDRYEDHNGEPPNLPPAGKPLEDWTVDEHLAVIQTATPGRPAPALSARQPKAVPTVSTSIHEGFTLEAGLVENPGTREIIFTATTVTSPDVDHDVVERERRRARATAHGQFVRRRCGRRARTPVRRARHRGAGRPAGRTRRSPSARSSAASGSSGKSDSDGPGDAGPHLELAPKPRAIYTFGCLTREQRGEDA